MKPFVIVSYFMVLLFSPGLLQAQGFFLLETQGLESKEISAAQELLQKAESLLPVSLKVQFPQGIQVAFSLKGQAHGKALLRSKNPKIALNSKLLDVVVLGENNSPLAKDEKGNIRIHKTAYREALASVIHEAAHFYDYLNLQIPETAQWIGFCMNVPTDNTVMIGECGIYRNIKTTVSTNPYYLEVAGWSMMANGQQGDRNSDNTFRFRSPDPYELKNSEEHFAVNFEYFLLDPTFACRRPALASFFANHFKVSLPICTAKLKYVDPDATDIDPKTKLIKNLFKEIPLDRVYQVHYLLAEPGTSMMSRFGHSMLRLVICAPGQPMGPACLTEGLPHNLVLSFRAFINTPQINSVAGLTGKYPSRLFVVPLENVIQEYNEVEYRGLKSYPLNLSRAEIKSLVERSLETHWSYDSKYYFISNNCAVETMNLLKASLLKSELINKRIIYPKELLDVLLKEKLASPIPRNSIAAIEQGYYFDSSEIKHLQSFNSFFQKNVGGRDLKEFLKLPIDKRRELYFQRFSQMERPLKYKDIVSPFQLERYALMLKKADFHSEVTQHIWLNNTGHGITSLKDMNLNEIYQKAIEAFGSLSAPYQILKLTDYGIPNEAEIEDSVKEITAVRDRIQEARDVEIKVKKELEQNKTYQEILQIRSLISDILDVK